MFSTGGPMGSTRVPVGDENGMSMQMNVLEGIKVVDVTAWAFVPSAGGVMAHWGADVIKVESPSAPDPMRTGGSSGGTLEPEGSGDMFKHYSRGKRSIGINLASDEGRAVLYKLVEDADVFLTSYLPPTRKKLKIDVDDIRAINPNIIYARGSGQGPKGPDASRPGYDGITWWGRGSLAQTTMDVSGAEWPTGMVGHGDGMSGMTLAGGICAALVRRALSGVASVVDGSLMGTAIWFNGPNLIAVQHGTKPREFKKVARPAPTGPAAFRSATMAIYQTKDNRFLNLLFLGDADRDYADICGLLGRPELADDPRFAHAPERIANSAELLPIFEDIFATKTLAEWKVVLQSARGAWAPISTPEDIYEDPQTKANGFLRPAKYKKGDLMLPVPPILFDEEAGDPPVAPDFAQHTDEILEEHGLSGEDIKRLKDTGAVV